MSLLRFTRFKTNVYEISNDHSDLIPVEAFIAVHPEYSEYIPLHYLTNWIYTLKSMDDLTPVCNDLVVMARPEYFSNPNAKLYNTRSVYDFKDYLYKYETTVAGRGLHFYRGKFNAAIGVKSDFVRSLYDQYFNFLFEESVAFKIYSQNNFFDDSAIFKKVMCVLSGQWFKKNIDSDTILDNSKIFISETRGTRNKINNYYSDSVFRGVPKVTDSLDGYFMSKLFAKVEIPQFEEIDGPEKLAVEIAKKI